jgi:dihydrofolate synthase/folylpolyglutamate synthase
MDYAAAIEFLYGLRLFGTKLGLENTFALANLVGNPHRHLRFIHVAGTNGKGSVCAFLESIYRHAGLRVGLFTSPHLVSFTERLQVKRVPISQADVCRLTEKLIERLGGPREEWPFRPTFFEFVTILALVYFQEQKCDLVIWETGLGGRLDATNIVTPLASVITNIQFDHQQWLGNTLAQIAHEKAGIIKPHVPVITGPMSTEALTVIQSTATSAQSPLTIVNAFPRSRGSESAHFSVPSTDLEKVASARLSLLGEHQKTNASVALATVRALQNTIPVPPSAITEAFSHTFWPGRLQQLQIRDSTLLLDGAHNPDGARALVHALDHLFPARERTLVIGLFKDKAWQEMCEILIPGAARVFLVPLHNERSVNPDDVRAYSAERWPSTRFTISNSSSAAVDTALKFPFVIVAGSLHLIGEVMEHLGIAPALPSERELNEWDAARAKT